ncbi:hypothetical protein ISS85_04535 [Candidatus Microgenomates bacterium]|nr:hypothetical protein [Candidatus Microgenomates bacterium]
MIIHETEGFKKDLKRLSQKTKKKFQKQIKLLVTDFFYPSLHNKKIKGEKNVWEARVDYHYRFSLKKEDKNIYLLSIGLTTKV